ncbi:unnamed protein product, partial [Rotaria sp. Silwood2]
YQLQQQQQHWTQPRLQQQQQHWTQPRLQQRQPCHNRLVALS